MRFTIVAAALLIGAGAQAQQIEKRVYEIGAVLSLEVGKNRMEGLGDAQETADMIYWACDQMEANNGYIKEMGRDPLAGYRVSNVSILLSQP